MASRTVTKKTVRGKQKTDSPPSIIADILHIPEPIHMGEGIYCSLATVSPSIAEEWLERNHPNNRFVSKVSVTAFARDMSGGGWKLNHHGIAFDSDLLLVDGQHRLSAIIQSNQAIETFVYFNLPTQALNTIDSGRTRTFLDSMKIAGRPIGSFESAMIRRMLTSDYHGGNLKFTNHEMADLYDDLREAIGFAKRWKQKARKDTRPLRATPIWAAIAVAWYHVDEETLSEFCEEFVTGIVSEKSHASVIALRTHILSTDSGYSGETYARDLYCKTQHALNAYINGRVLKVIRAVHKGVWRVPDISIEHFKPKELKGPMKEMQKKRIRQQMAKARSERWGKEEGYRPRPKRNAKKG